MKSTLSPPPIARRQPKKKTSRRQFTDREILLKCLQNNVTQLPPAEVVFHDAINWPVLERKVAIKEQYEKALAEFQQNAWRQLIRKLKTAELIPIAQHLLSNSVELGSGKDELQQCLRKYQPARVDANTTPTSTSKESSARANGRPNRQRTRSTNSRDTSQATPVSRTRPARRRPPSLSSFSSRSRRPQQTRTAPLLSSSARPRSLQSPRSSAPRSSASRSSAPRSSAPRSSRSSGSYRSSTGSPGILSQDIVTIPAVQLNTPPSDESPENGPSVAARVKRQSFLHPAFEPSSSNRRPAAQVQLQSRVAPEYPVYSSQYRAPPANNQYLGEVEDFLDELG